MRRRRRRRLSPSARRLTRNLLLVALAGLALLGAAAGYRLLRAGQELRRVEAIFDDVNASIDAGDAERARVQLIEATSRLTRASGHLHGHVELDVVRAIPVLGGNLKTLRDSVTVATQLAAGGARIVGAATPLQGPDGHLDVSLDGGRVPLEAVQAVQREAQALVGELPDPDELDDVDPGFLFGPVRDVRERVVEEVARRRQQARAAADGLALLADLAGASGRRAYLIAVANTAEMRGTGGMILSWGGLIGEGGTLTRTDFGRIDGLALQEPVDRSFVPDLPDDYLRRWDGFDPLLRWRNANVGADFTMVAPVLEAMFVARTGTPIDGVIQVDPTGLAELLRAVGPVTVPELGEVGADTAVPLVLHEAYLRYRNIDRRSDVVGDVAEAAFERLLTGRFDSLRPIGTALANAVQGRHLMVHTVHADAQRRVAALGADGSLPSLDGPDATHLTVQNLSGNKLDFFVETEVGLAGDVRPGRPGTVRAEVVIRNTAPEADDPVYIFGPFDDDQEVGVYRGLASLYLPRGATLLSSSGEGPHDQPIEVSEGGRPVVSWTVDLPPGGTSHLVLELRLAPRPEGPYQLLAVPQARVRPTVLVTDLETGDGRIAGRLVLDRTYRLRPGAPPEPVAGGSAPRPAAAAGPRP